MSSLKEFSQNYNSRTGPIPWRDQSDSNRAAWIEALEGVKNGTVTFRGAAIWLVEDQGCPLAVDYIRTQLRNTMERYVKS